MSASRPLVAIVILNWNGGEMTVDCLRSLASVTHEPCLPIVVDNASTDGSPERIATAFPDVEVVRNRDNLGFAGGNNVGIARALEHGADFVLILNNDTLLDPPVIDELLTVAARRPDAGAFSPVIYFAEPADLLWFAGADYDPRRAYPGRMLGYRERDTGRVNAVRATGRLTGAGMFVRREAIEATGMFDDDLFFLYEDVDWSLRMREAGYSLLLVPSARIWHRVAATQRGEHSPLSVYYGVRNQIVVSRRHAPLSSAPAAARVAGTIAVNGARLRRCKQRVKGVRALMAGAADGIRGRLGPAERAWL